MNKTYGGYTLDHLKEIIDYFFIVRNGRLDFFDSIHKNKDHFFSDTFSIFLVFLGILIDKIFKAFVLISEVLLFRDDGINPIILMMMAMFRIVMRMTMSLIIFFMDVSWGLLLNH